MVTTAIKPAAAAVQASTASLARAAISELVAFWAELPVDPIEPRDARVELMDALPSLRRLADAVGG
jgi:hypothetical protein